MTQLQSPISHQGNNKYTSQTENLRALPNVAWRHCVFFLFKLLLEQNNRIYRTKMRTRIANEVHTVYIQAFPCLLSCSVCDEKILLWYYKSKNCLKPRWPRLDPRSGHVICRQVAPGRVFSEYFGLPCQFHPPLRIHSLSQYRRHIFSIMSASLNNQLLKTVSTMSFMNNLDITKYCPPT
jgi:hypothetical protein